MPVTNSEYVFESESDDSSLSDKIEQGLENGKAKIKKLMDWDLNGKIEINDAIMHCKECFGTLSWFYDVSIDNLPGGSILGMILTIISSFFISTGLVNCSGIITKYVPEAEISNFEYFYTMSMAFFIVLHMCVLFHGLSITSLETSRECGAKEIGCYCCCKNKKTRMGKCCRIFQSCSQKSTQIVWGVVGTVLMFLFYGFSIGIFVTSTMTVGTSYYTKQSCDAFSRMIDQAKNQSVYYIAEAKQHVNSADNVALMILSQYNGIVNMKERYLDSGMGQVDTTKDTITNPGSGMFQEKMFMSKKMGRILTDGDFNPLQKISEGRSVLSTLNSSIYESEKQVEYYSVLLDYAEEVCYDYGSLYNEFYTIAIGAGLLLLSHFIMFGAHYKYFSVWNYEARLVKFN
jgi:hypothetical protein